MIEARPTRPLPLRRVTDSLARHELFANLDPAGLARLAEGLGTRDLPAGAVLFREGEPGDDAYLVLDGRLEIVFDVAGSAMRVGEAGEGQIVGEIGALCRCPRTATVVARDDSLLLRITQGSLREVARRSPEFALGLVEALGRRLRDTNRPLAYLTYAAMALHDDRLGCDELLDRIRADGELIQLGSLCERMAEHLAASRVARQEMETAAAIQASILPKGLAWGRSGPFAEVAAAIRPARDIGGDFYDYFLVGDDRLGIVIGDVSGKGVPAALFMAVVRTALRTTAISGCSPGECLRRANATLCEGNDELMFATVFYGVLDAASGELVYANAGHDPPYLLRTGPGAGRRPERLPGTGGMPLAVVEGAGFAEHRTTLGAGDILLLYTDGVTESLDGAGRMFSASGLEAGLAQTGDRGSCDALVRSIVRDVEAFAGGAPQADDITCLAVRYRPGGGA